MKKSGKILTRKGLDKAIKRHDLDLVKEVKRLQREITKLSKLATKPMLVKVKAKPKVKRKKSTFAPPPVKNGKRCERCGTKVPKSQIIERYNDKGWEESVCKGCLFKWYVAVVEPGHNGKPGVRDTKTKTKLLDNLRRGSCKDRVKQVLIPKVLETQTRTALWEVIGETMVSVQTYKVGDPAFKTESLGKVYADSEEEAVAIAKRKFKDKIEKEGVRIVGADMIKPPGRKVSKYVSAFPGYLVIHMELDKAVDSVLKTTKGVLGLLPVGVDKPTAVESEEAARLLIRETERRKGPKPVKYDYVVGDRVRIATGAFKSFTGTVRHIKHDPYDPRFTVEVVILTIPTEVPGLKVSQIEREDNERRPERAD